MDKDRVKGTVDDAMGRARRQAGEWTGDMNKRVEGAAQQIKGRAEKAWGNVKDAARDANAGAQHGNDSHPRSGPILVDRNRDRPTGNSPH